MIMSAGVPRVCRNYPPKRKRNCDKVSVTSLYNTLHRAGGSNRSSSSSLMARNFHLPSALEGPKFEKGQTSASRDSAESDRPTRRRPASGSEDRLSTLLREDAEEFGEFFHEGKASAPPKVRSFEEDALLKRPPPDYEQSQEH